MKSGLDLHLDVDKTAGFEERTLETALREAVWSGWLADAPGSGTPSLGA